MELGAPISLAVNGCSFLDAAAGTARVATSLMAALPAFPIPAEAALLLSGVSHLLRS